MKRENTMKVFAGSSNPALAEEISRYLDIELGKCVLERFNDGEIHFYIDENVRGEDIFIVQVASFTLLYSPLLGGTPPPLLICLNL